MPWSKIAVELQTTPLIWSCPELASQTCLSDQMDSRLVFIELFVLVCIPNIARHLFYVIDRKQNMSKDTQQWAPDGAVQRVPISADSGGLIRPKHFEIGFSITPYV